MDTKRKLIDLQGLGHFLSDLKVFIKNYFDSRIDKSIDKTSDNPIANSVVSKAQWVGKGEDVDAAILSGEIIPGYTTVIISDDDDKEVIFQFASTQDIYDLFGLIYAG